MILSKINIALDKALVAFAQANSIDIAFPGKTYTMNNNVFLQVKRLPGQIENTSIGPNGVLTYYGIYQIDIVTPDTLAQNVGLGKNAELADMLTTNPFFNGAVLTESDVRLTVTDNRLGPMLQEKGVWYQPLSVSYRAHKIL